MHRFTGFACLLTLLGLLLIPATPVVAQDASANDDASTQGATDPGDDSANKDKKEASAKPVVSEEITVTARKREENIQEVPVAVTVVSADQLEDRGASDISEIQADVPNLSIYAGRNQSTTITAFMRGIGQADPLWGVDPGVGLYLDDVYLARPQGALLDVLDVGQIEVLRGPQGTLYGKNT
ncbi:MAG: Plug domain-containing protein, partial [Acidobacteria bacterium]|nr:Plug domain-containing protein [Acidobacteriota bacterium]